MTIGKATKRRMAANFAMDSMMFSIIVFPFWHREPESWLVFLAGVLCMPLLLSLFPLVADFGKGGQAERVADRARWREEYRQSPESNMINLRD